MNCPFPVKGSQNLAKRDEGVRKSLPSYAWALLQPQQPERLLDMHIYACTYRQHFIREQDLVLLEPN